MTTSPIGKLRIRKWVAVPRRHRRAKEFCSTSFTSRLPNLSGGPKSSRAFQTTSARSAGCWSTMRRRGAPRTKNLIVLGRLADEYTPTFHKHHVWNDWTLAMRDVPFGKATICGSLIERRIVHKTAFYADILRPQGIADMICVSHRAMAQDGGVGGLGFGVPPHESEDPSQALFRKDRPAFAGKSCPHSRRVADRSVHWWKLELASASRH